MSIVSEISPHDAIAPSSAERGRIRLEYLFRIAVPRLRGMIIARLGSLSLADVYDISQEVCLAFVRREALGNMACFNGHRIGEIGDDEFERCIENCCAYLFRIAGNKCDEFHRRNNSHLSAVSQWVDGTQKCETDPLVSMIQRERANHLRQAVARLPKLLCRVVILHFYQRRTDEQIGAALGMSARSIRRCLRKSLDQLRADLQSEYPNEMEGNGHPR